jgi:hypothetical protein
MTTRLDKTLRRAITIRGEPWVIALSPGGLKLTRKGRRKGVELEWPALASGDAALAAALNASVRAARGVASAPDNSAARRRAPANRNGRASRPARRKG